MKRIATLDQHELGLYEESDSPVSRTRYASRAVVVNSKGQVALMYFSETGSYKLPGGGIEDGETPIIALGREVLEETGYEIEDIKELGYVEEIRYCWSMKQIAYAYSAKASKFLGANLTDDESSQGMELRWFDDVAEAIDAVNSSHIVGAGSTLAGLSMMKLREVAILEYYANSR